jgi:formylglycine-generating enzyme required for sulfatase activity
MGAMSRSSAILLLLACGGQTIITIPPSASDFSPPPADAVAYDTRLGTLAEVPGGRARLGDWLLNTTNLFVWQEEDGAVPTAVDLAPVSCNPAGGFFGGEVVVAPFNLMTTEVTNQAYSVCVNSGACAPPDLPTFDGNGQPTDWTAPSVATQPVVLSWPLARSFCRHYGGDLPTAGEYARATVGDAETYAQPDMLAIVLACAMSPTAGQPDDTPECVRLRKQSGGGPGAIADVATDPNDIGPFGHYDLYANALEWVRGFFSDTTVNWCAGPIDEHDIILSFPSANNPVTLLFLPNLPIPDAQSFMAPETVSPDNLFNTSGMMDGIQLGFRCALPTTE